jgi:hypothetical protein
MVPRKRGKWWATDRFTQVDAANKWGKTPDEFWALSKSDQAYMIAYCNVSAMIESHEAYEQERAVEQAKARAKK